MYKSGQGVPQNYKEAAAWFRSAAMQGHADAQSSLGNMYSEGLGVHPNPVIAYMLEILAAAQGNEIARQNRDISLQSLSREQVNEGQRLASEWRVGSGFPVIVRTWP